MCFGPVASFTASAFLASMGTVILKNIRAKKELWFAAFPLIFSAHQFIEGLLWLVLKEGKSPALERGLAFAFLVVAYGLWPVLCPMSVYAIEYNAGRKKILRVFIALGAVTSAYLLFSLIQNPFSVTALNCSLRYTTFVPGGHEFTGLYLAVTILPYFLSSQRAILFFGLPNVFFCALAIFAYRTTFISVWCFFAAVISANLYFFLRRLHHEPLLPSIH